jgi:hypothetical protein
MCKRNLIYTHKKSIAFPAPTFTKSTTFKQHYMQISYQISPKLGNILKVDKYSFMPPNEVQAFSAPIFIKLTQQILWKTPVLNFTQIWWKIWKNSHNVTLHLKYQVNHKVQNKQKGLSVQHHLVDMTVYLTVAKTLLMLSQNSFITQFKLKYVAVIHSLSIIKCNFYIR